MRSARSSSSGGSSSSSNGSSFGSRQVPLQVSDSLGASERNEAQLIDIFECISEVGAGMNQIALYVAQNAAHAKKLLLMRAARAGELVDGRGQCAIRRQRSARFPQFRIFRLGRRRVAQQGDAQLGLGGQCTPQLIRIFTHYINNQSIFPSP